MTKDNTLDLLGQALDQESWEWLQSERPDIAERLELAVDAGNSAQEIRRLAYVRTGRTEIVNRLQAAARWLEHVGQA